MSPRYSNVTSSIRGHDYTIWITQSQFIYSTNTKDLKECPKISTGETEDENVHQPRCIDYPNVTSGIRKLSAITYIK